ncbi:MAG: GGDEF domain-containing protein [Desulfobacterales bacterium]
MRSENILDEIINGIGKLPTLPGVAIKILETVQDQKRGLKELAEILSTDPPLSAEVLRLINSPYYGFNTRITSVQHAVKLLGATTVKNLALSFSVVKSFKNSSLERFDYTQFWKDSLFSAVAMKSMARKISRQAADDAFFLGLLHNIGLLTLNQCMPDQYCLVLAEMKKNQFSYHDAEQQVLGFTHMDIGGLLVKKWGLPDNFYLPIEHHHFPAELKNGSPEILQMTHLLHLTALLIDFVNLPDKAYQLGLIEHFVTEYGLGEHFQLEPLLHEVGELTAAVFPVFEIKIDSETHYIEMIEAARKELIHLSSDFLNRLIEQNKRIEILNERATHDGLTKLTNYQRFQEVLDEEMYRANRYRFPLTLLMVDLDHFKKVNDTFGHLAGDHILRETSELIRKSLRKSDIAARYGGEEFALLLPETPQEGAYILAERLREKLAAKSFAYGDHTIFVTMSVGIAAYAPKTDSSNADLIKKADTALYRAKDQGRNRCCLFSSC